MIVTSQKVNNIQDVEKVLDPLNILRSKRFYKCFIQKL